MGYGVLRKGLRIHNDIVDVRVLKGTEVRMTVEDGTPTIAFSGIRFLRLLRIDGKWWSEFCGTLMKVTGLEDGKLPYPLSYFR